MDEGRVAHERREREHAVVRFSEIYDPLIVVAALIFIGFVAGRLSSEKGRPKE